MTNTLCNTFAAKNILPSDERVDDLDDVDDPTVFAVFRGMEHG
jgi:hypothetical protein